MRLRVWVQIGEGRLMVPTRIGFFFFFSFWGFGYWASALGGVSSPNRDSEVKAVSPVCSLCAGSVCIYLLIYLGKLAKTPHLQRGILLNLGTNERGGVPPGFWDVGIFD